MSVPSDRWKPIGQVDHPAEGSRSHIFLADMKFNYPGRVAYKFVSKTTQGPQTEFIPFNEPANVPHFHFIRKTLRENENEFNCHWPPSTAAGCPLVKSN
jgi:hypothetical protein